ncbi:protein FAM122A isoform X1 [Polypterus senegalus]|uniref:protein FAM122A isoform X1 n=1 Tax=Polypterus senegalus TaxID=55291 RepID=UPI00196555C6|nr:protein FAM122A isoform X1 [Polypterus senegalus]
MERMDIDQCAGAAAGNGGGALRRSNSAPMITGVSDGTAVFSSSSSARFRRSSMSVNLGCPGLALSPFWLTSNRLDHHRQEESMEQNAQDPLHRDCPGLRSPFVEHVWDENFSLPNQSIDSCATPNSSPSPTRRFGSRGGASPRILSPPLCTLKRKGGADLDGPPKKLFVAGVPGLGTTESPVNTVDCTLSVSQVTGVASSVSSCSPPHGNSLSLAVSIPDSHLPMGFTPPFATQPPGM